MDVHVVLTSHVGIVVEYHCSALTTVTYGTVVGSTFLVVDVNATVDFSLFGLHHAAVSLDRYDVAAGRSPYFNLVEVGSITVVAAQYDGVLTSLQVYRHAHLADGFSVP